MIYILRLVKLGYSVLVSVVVLLGIKHTLIICSCMTQVTLYDTSYSVSLSSTFLLMGGLKQVQSPVNDS